MRASRGRELGLVNGQRFVGLQGVVDHHERKAATESLPKQHDWVQVFVDIFFDVKDLFLETRDTSETSAKGDTALEQASLFVGGAIDDIVGGSDGAAAGSVSASDGCRVAWAEESGVGSVLSRVGGSQRLRVGGMLRARVVSGMLDVGLTVGSVKTGMARIGSGVGSNHVSVH